MEWPSPGSYLSILGYIYINFWLYWEARSGLELVLTFGFLDTHRFLAGPGGREWPSPSPGLYIYKTKFLC